MKHELDRFIEAQATTFPIALAELRGGRKASHWMWFIFPQIAGLGRSSMAQHYAIASRDEAIAYLTHPRLGPRLREASAAVLVHAGARTAEAIMGGIDAVKLRSSMTLFEAVADDPSVFARVLDAFFGGERDAATLARL